MKKVILAVIVTLLLMNASLAMAEILPALTITDTGYGGGALTVREGGSLPLTKTLR